MNDQDPEKMSTSNLPAFCQSVIDHSVELADGVFLFRDPNGRLPSSLLVGYTVWLPPGLLLPTYLPPHLIYAQFVKEADALDIAVGLEVPAGTLIETFSPDRGRIPIGTANGNGNPPFRMHDGKQLFLVDDKTGKIIHQN